MAYAVSHVCWQELCYDLLAVVLGALLHGGARELPCGASNMGGAGEDDGAGERHYEEGGGNEMEMFGDSRGGYLGESRDCDAEGPKHKAPRHKRRHKVPEAMAHSTRHTAHGTRHTAHGTWHMAHGTRHMAHGTWHMAHGTWHMQPGCRQPCTGWCNISSMQAGSCISSSAQVQAAVHR